MYSKDQPTVFDSSLEVKSFFRTLNTADVDNRHLRLDFTHDLRENCAEACREISRGLMALEPSFLLSLEIDVGDRAGAIVVAEGIKHCNALTRPLIFLPSRATNVLTTFFLSFFKLSVTIHSSLCSKFRSFTTIAIDHYPFFLPISRSPLFSAPQLEFPRVGGRKRCCRSD